MKKLLISLLILLIFLNLTKQKIFEWKRKISIINSFYVKYMKVEEDNRGIYTNIESSSTSIKQYFQKNKNEIELRNVVFILKGLFKPFNTNTKYKEIFKVKF